MAPGVGVTSVDDSAPFSPMMGRHPRVYLCGDRKKNGTFYHLLTQHLLSTRHVPDSLISLLGAMESKMDTTLCPQESCIPAGRLTSIKES